MDKPYTESTIEKETDMVQLHPDSHLLEEAVGRDVPSHKYPLGYEPLFKEWNDGTRESYAIPRLMRIELPMNDQRSFRSHADYLRGLATTLDVISRRTDISEVEAMICIASEIRQTNQKIKQTTKSRKPR